MACVHLQYRYVRPFHLRYILGAPTICLPHRDARMCHSCDFGGYWHLDSRLGHQCKGREALEDCRPGTFEYSGCKCLKRVCWVGIALDHHNYLPDVENRRAILIGSLGDYGDNLHSGGLHHLFNHCAHCPGDPTLRLPWGTGRQQAL